MKMDRSSAIYFAKQAYDLWIMRGVIKAGFGKSATEGYLWTGTAGWVVLLKRNGSLSEAIKQR